jgi:hypothetical protein
MNKLLRISIGIWLIVTIAAAGAMIYRYVDGPTMAAQNAQILRLSADLQSSTDDLASEQRRHRETQAELRTVQSRYTAYRHQESHLASWMP